MRALPSVRASLAWIVLTASVATLGLATAAPAEAASVTTYITTNTVSVRSSKSTTGTVVGKIAKGKHVQAASKAKLGWLPVKFNAKTAYISTKYVKADKKRASVVITGPVGKKTSLMEVTVRTKAKPSAAVAKVYAKNTVMAVTGEASGLYTKVNVSGVRGWASTRRLTAKTDIAPNTVANYVTTAALALRITASVSAKNQVTIATGKTVGGTGKHSGSYSEVVYSGKVGWVITGYLAATSGTPEAYTLPLRVTNVYTTAAVSLQKSPEVGAPVVGSVARGLQLRGTGAAQTGYLAVIWNGGISWVESAKATLSLGSSSLDKLEANGKAAVIDVRAQFPQLTTIHGWRSSSAYSSDHPNGRAVDFMIPSYKTNKALGDAVAAYVIANGKRLKVNYLIWRQRSYTLTRGTWKAMDDRGSDTQNHLDHVHVSFEPSSK